MRFLALFSVFLLLAAPAFAGWNIQQKDTGGTVWVDQNANSTPVGGGSVINIRISDISTAATEYVVSRRAGRIVALYGVSMSPGAGGNAVDNTITLWLEAAATNGNFSQVSGASITLSALSDAGTDEADTTGIGEVAGGGAGESDAVTQGQVIGINTNGSGTGTTPAMITIVIE